MVVLKGKFDSTFHQKGYCHGYVTMNVRDDLKIDKCEDLDVLIDYTGSFKPIIPISTVPITATLRGDNTFEMKTRLVWCNPLSYLLKASGFCVNAKKINEREVEGTYTVALPYDHGTISVKIQYM